ncbi:MAG: choice-of-anchor Q domain-containing protein [Dokdonella sp.]
MPSSRSFLSALVIALVLSVVGMSITHAATFVVTRVDDPNPASCTVASCSLREAVLAANASTGADVIELAEGQFSLTIGELLLTDAVTIIGTGRNTTRITVDGTFAVLRAELGISLTVTGLSILGPPPSPRSVQQLRGSIFAIICQRCVRLALTDVLVSVTAGYVFTNGDNAPGELTIDRSVIAVVAASQTSATIRISDSALQYAELTTLASGGVRVERSNFTLDLAPDLPSGLIIETSGSVDIDDTEIANTSQGLLIRSGTPLSVRLRRLRYLDNAEPVSVTEATDVSVIDSEFRGNTSVSETPGALLVNNGSSWTVSGSSFIGNRGDGNTGGAILVEGGASLDIDNSTFSGNSFTVAAAANSARGAAIGVRGGALGATLRMRHVTIVQPTFALDGIDGTTIGARGTDAQSSISIYNSILRGNCRLDAGLLDTGIGNIESIGDTCSLATSRNLVSVSLANLALGALADHGGPTLTYAPASNSVAVDYQWTDLECTPRDQRGYLRQAGTDCDIGAVEVGGLERIFVDGFDWLR